MKNKKNDSKSTVIKSTSENFSTKVKFVLKNTSFGRVPGTRITLAMTDDGCVRGIVKSSFFAGMSIPARHVLIRNSLKQGLTVSENRKVISILTGVPEQGK